MLKEWKSWTACLLIAGLAATLPAPAIAEAAKIVLDAGHGGSDPGAIGVNGLYEKTVNLDVTLRLKAELAARGYEVMLTRDQDVYLSLAERVALTDGMMPDLFVSVHANSHTNSSIDGSLVLYYDKDYPQASYPPSDAMAALSPESKRFAQLVQQQMVKGADTVDRGIVPSAAYVIRMGTVPSILVETAFLSNKQDAADLADPDFRQKLAVGIANGIELYKPASATPGPFADVLQKHWAAEAVAKLKNKGIIEGEYDRYYPERALTRAEFVTMLARQFPLPDLNTTVSEHGSTLNSGSNFEDSSSGSNGTEAGTIPGTLPGRTVGTTVTDATYSSPAGGKMDQQNAAADTTPTAPKDLSAAHWAYSFMSQALSKGILTGYSDGTIRPDKPITRGEAAALIDRVIWPDGNQTARKQVFADVPVSLWSAASISRLKEKGIVEGITATTFAPERAITRAEMAALLARLIH